MAQSSFSKAASLSLVVLVGASMAAMVSAQEMMAPAPAPSIMTGAGFSVPLSGAVVAVSLVASLMGFLKM
ncbi:hypothetical protein LINGRAHAP2_LOCUS20173 [Linum grandiflorum]